MKKIIIVTNQMIRGGVETALISMLNALDLTQMDVSVLLLRRGGVWEKRIPPAVHILYVDELCDPKNYLNELIIKGHPALALRKAFLLFRSIKAKSYWKENHFLTQFLPKLQQEYDVAIAYHAPGTLPVHYVLHNITSENKMLWIHGDVEKTKSVGEEYRQLFQQFDRIVCVSKEAERVFVKNYPEMKQSCFTVNNIVDTEYIDEAVSEPTTKQYSICTVARLSPEKGITLAVDACEQLIKKYPELTWCVCGGGPEENNLRKRITEKKLENNFILLGDQDNPYKYMISSEIYVQPSIHEGYCMTIAEARYLCKPIVTTCTTGALAQLTDGVDSTIVGMEAHEIAKAVDDLLSNHTIKEKYQSQLKQKQYVSDYKSMMSAISF